MKSNLCAYPKVNLKEIYTLVNILIYLQPSNFVDSPGVLGKFDPCVDRRSPIRGTRATTDTADVCTDPPRQLWSMFSENPPMW
jgi:hypothetical protein